MQAFRSGGWATRGDDGVTIPKGQDGNETWGMERNDEMRNWKAQAALDVIGHQVEGPLDDAAQKFLIRYFKSDE